MKSSIQRKINITFGVMFILVALFSFYFYLDKRDIDKIDVWITRQYKVKEQINSITSLSKNKPIQDLRNDVVINKENVKSKILKHLDSLKILTIDDKEQQKSIDSVYNSINIEFNRVDFLLEPSLHKPRVQFNPDSHPHRPPRSGPPPMKFGDERRGPNDFMAMKKNLDLLEKIDNAESLSLDRRINELEERKADSEIKFFVLIFLFFIILIIFYWLIKIDIKLRTKVEQELKEKSEELKIINAHKDRLFSVIAHDLRSPFQPIIGLSEILISEAANLKAEEVEYYGVQLKKISKNVFNMLENLLVWSKIQSGKVNYDPIKLFLREKVAQVFQNLKINADKKIIELCNSVGEDFCVSADENMLTSILQNLISNAIKFTSNNGKINVAAKVEEQYILISVSDNGIGIEKGNIEKLFNIEMQFSTKGTDSENGSGLGLLLCKDFVEKHNGKIWVESEVGKGSTFYFTLPKPI